MSPIKSAYRPTKWLGGGDGRVSATCALLVAPEYASDLSCVDSTANPARRSPPKAQEFFTFASKKVGYPPRYWWKGQTAGEGGGRLMFQEQVHSLRLVVGSRTLDVTRDGLIRAAGPYARNHPQYLLCWWDWVTGSTPLFWNWKDRYAEEVRDG